MSDFVSDFKQIPMSLVYAYDSPDDQLNTLNTLITDCIDKHAPLKRVRLIRPPAPWMSDLNIQNLQNQFTKHKMRNRGQNLDMFVVNSNLYIRIQKIILPKSTK